MKKLHVRNKRGGMVKNPKIARLTFRFVMRPGYAPEDWPYQLHISNSHHHMNLMNVDRPMYHNLSMLDPYKAYNELMYREVIDLKNETLNRVISASHK